MHHHRHALYAFSAQGAIDRKLLLGKRLPVRGGHRPMCQVLCKRFVTLIFGESQQFARHVIQAHDLTLRVIDD